MVQQTSLFNGNEFNRVSFARDIQEQTNYKSIVNLVSIKMFKEKEVDYRYKSSISCKDDIVDMVKHLLNHDIYVIELDYIVSKRECREIAVCICLDTNYNPTNISIVNTGFSNKCAVEPSTADWKLTKQLKDAMTTTNRSRAGLTSQQPYLELICLIISSLTLIVLILLQ